MAHEQQPRMMIERLPDGLEYVYDRVHDTYAPVSAYEEGVMTVPQASSSISQQFVSDESNMPIVDQYEGYEEYSQPQQEKTKSHSRLARFAGKTALAGVGLSLLYGAAYVGTDVAVKFATFRQDQITFDHIKDNLINDITHKLAGE